MSDLKDKVALITGGSRGIGRAISIALARAGAKVVLTYNENRALGEQTVDNITMLGGNALALQMKVEDRTSVRKALLQVRSMMGRISILVNNAGIAQEKKFESITDDDWDRMLMVNLRGAFTCCQEVLPDMLKQKWGRIINITSIGGQWGGFNQVHYAAAKSGLINLSQSLARIYSSQGILTNAVAPGLVGTDMSDRELNSEDGIKKVESIPIGRIATADEVANIVVFLAGESANYITGQTISANGGMYFG